MRAPFEHRGPEPDERQVRYLSDQRGVGLVPVRELFRHELAGLGIGAKVGSYLAVLTASNVRGMLRRKAHIAGQDAGPAGQALPLASTVSMDSRVDPFPS